MPMIRRIAKRGFYNKFGQRVGEVNIADLEANFTAGDEVTPESLRKKDLANYRYDVLKVLGNGEISKKLTVSCIVSANLREKRSKKPVGPLSSCQRRNRS